MRDSVAGVVLAAGLGERLRPLTVLRPKALCPVANVPLVDLAMARLTPTVGAVAVNVHHHRAALEDHLAGLAHCSVEDELLGTAGALGKLRGWLEGRAAIVVNADTWCPGGVEPLLEGWDGERIRVLVAGGDQLEATSVVAGAVLPWAELARLEPVPSWLYRDSWLPALEAGRLEVVRYEEPVIDCGTPAGYLRANLTANGGASVVAEGAVVEGELVRSVVWSGARVRPGEVVVDGIRYERERTVFVRGR
jgi:MurNAc alpha-1-phosphate uridylyltransferase